MIDSTDIELIQLRIEIILQNAKAAAKAIDPFAPEYNNLQAIINSAQRISDIVNRT